MSYVFVLPVTSKSTDEYVVPSSLESKSIAMVFEPPVTLTSKFNPDASVFKPTLISKSLLEPSIVILVSTSSQLPAPAVVIDVHTFKSRSLLLPVTAITVSESSPTTTPSNELVEPI